MNDSRGKIATLDMETRSHADLPKVGAESYFRHPTTDIICLAYAIENDPIQTWWPGKYEHDYCPEDLLNHIGTGGLIECHNISFEWCGLRCLMTPKYGWPLVLNHAWRDTMAVAAYYSMPLALDRLAKALGFPPKNPEGTRLITKYSKLYLKTAKEDIPDDDFEKFVQYCCDDVFLEQGISDELGDLPDHELEVFLLDLETNARGIYLDLEGIENAEFIAKTQAEELREEFRSITGLNPTQDKALKPWFAGAGIFLDNMQKGYLEDLLEEEGSIPQGKARRALEIRLEINKASTKKLAAMARQRSTYDGRSRFQTRYHGAVTGRNTGTGWQPLNMNRGFEKMDPVQIARDISYRNSSWLKSLYGDPLDVIAKATRAWVMAQPGYEITAGDFVSVEAIINACLAGEGWKIQAFHEGAKIYELMGDKIHGLAPGTVTKDTHPAERQDGKTGELAFGYQGALNAWLKFDKSGRHSDERIIKICKAWRSEHPAIVELWRGLEDAALGCLLDGKPMDYRMIGFEEVDEWLTMILPDGKRLWYREPEVRLLMPQWHRPETDPECAAGECECKRRPQVTYMTHKGGRWFRTKTYGGKLTENAVQAVSRQILRDARLRLRAEGYKGEILTVYDEIVHELLIGQGSVEEYKDILEYRPAGSYYQHWPISADCWQGQRYRK